MTTQVVSAKTAGCAVPDKAAWCAVPDQDPGAHRITKSGQISLAPALDRFYAERPSIVGA
jgi:hypothetical protein